MPRVISEAVQALGVESGKLICQVNIVNAAGTQVLMSTRSPVGDMPQLDIVSGSITTDDSREIPGSGTCRLIAQDAKIDDIVPRSARHPLSPLARSRIQVYFHAAADPYTNRTAYGMYDIARTELNEDGSGVTIDLEFFDLARRIQRARFPGPWLVLKGTSYEQMVINMLIGVVSEDDIFTVPRLGRPGFITSGEAQDDRLAELKKMETAAGYRFDYNWDGRGQLGYVPDTSETDEPIWDFQEGGNARILSGNRALSDEESYNGVIAIGKAQASDKPPVRGEAWDTNVNSLTYYDPANPDASTYGPVPSSTSLRC